MAFQSSQPKYTRRRLSSRDREKLYDRCRGDQEFPTCNICGDPVDGTRQEWDESHDGVPHALGGTETGIAHRRCNREHGAKVVTPMVAKAKRVRQKFIGAFRTTHPMPCGRASNRSIALGGGVKPRLSLAERHRATKKIFRRPAATDPLVDLTDGLIQGDLAESAFTHAATALGAPLEEISDLIVLARVSAAMVQA